MKKAICLLLTCVMLLSGVSAFAANPTGTASVWDHDIYVEGNLAECLDASGKPLYPLSYNGSIYVPLRSAAEWLGKDITKSADGNTFSLSGTKEPVYHDRVTSSEKPADTAAITVLSGAQLRLDNNAVPLTDASGKAVNIISSNDEPYLPVRSVANMLGMSLKYVNPTYRSSQVIYIRTPLTDEQLKTCKEYASILSNADLEFRTLFEDNIYFKNLSQLSTAMKSVESSRDIAKKFKNTQRPDIKLLTGCYKKIDELANDIMKGCDLAEQLIKANAPIEQVLYIMADDYTGVSYYPSRTIPPDDSLGVEGLCQILTLRAGEISRIVNETI